MSKCDSGFIQRLWFLWNRIGRRWRYSGLQSFLPPAQWWQHPQFPLHGILWVFSPDKCVFNTKYVYQMELIFPFRDIKLWWCRWFLSLFILWSRRWLPEQWRVRWDVQEAVRRPEPHQLPVRAGLWQLCRPGEGQPEFPPAQFQSTSALFWAVFLGVPQENAHFSISESLIAAIELMKYNLRHQEEEGEEEGDSDSEIQQLKQKIRLRRQQIRRSRMLPSATSQRGEPPFKTC